MFTSERIATRTLNDFVSGTSSFCDMDHVCNKFLAMFDELEEAMHRGQNVGERLLSWRSVFKLLLQGRDLESLSAANALCAE